MTSGLSLTRSGGPASSALLQLRLRESVAVTFQRERVGAVCDDPSSRRAVTAIMARLGFEVAFLEGCVSDMLAQISDLSPALVVFDLACSGSRGLAIVQDLQSAAPGCIVVLLAPFPGLRQSALVAGAYDLTGTDDLRGLERCLRRLVAELDAGELA